jgi:Protein of unknown function (DUF559)
MAAVLACGPDAALSHVSAAMLWGIWDGITPRWPHVSVPTHSGRRAAKGIAFHRSRTLRQNDVVKRKEIPLTTLPRTLLDVTATLTPKQLRSTLRQAERLHNLDLPRLRQSLDALLPSDHRRARLARVLDAYVPGTGQTEGDPETAYLAICAAYGIPLPEPQVPIGRYRVDFLWRDIGLAVEIDDRNSHDGHIAFRDDRVRERFLRAAGLELIRFTSQEVGREPAQVAAETKAARARRI